MGTIFKPAMGLMALLMDCVGEYIPAQDTEGYWSDPLRAHRRPIAHPHTCEACGETWNCYLQRPEIGPFYCYNCRESPYVSRRSD